MYLYTSYAYWASAWIGLTIAAIVVIHYRIKEKECDMEFDPDGDAAKNGYYERR